MTRIIAGGFQHETSTFAPTPADYSAFTTPGAWPGLTRGEGLFEALAEINVGMGGFAPEARASGAILVPTVWAQANPSAPVTRETYERIVTMLLEDIAAALPADGIYLDLHGAMVAEHFEDGEGELLRRVREIAGPDLPLVASLDLHANVTPLMVEQASALVAFRTYPHIDMAETGARAARHLLGLIGGSGHAHKAYWQCPFLIPLTSQCTMTAPAEAIYAGLDDLERGEVGHVSLCMGFPLADIRECGATVVAYARNARDAEVAVATVAAAVEATEGEFASEYWTPDDAVREAMRIASAASRPVLLADTQDNPGAGADSDTTGLIESLIRLGAEGAVVGILNDPAAAEAAHAAGEGATIKRGIGEGSGLPGHKPLDGRWRVAALGDGEFEGTGPFYKGSRMRLGPMALLECGGVRVVVSSRKQQAADQAMFRHLGVEPAAAKILGLKSSVHFRADFQPIAEAVMIVTAPGPSIADTLALDYRRLRQGVRLAPHGPVFSGPKAG
ncbi:MAG: M81 family metallopeptidase [Rhodospirillaceae bacterium]|nr:M81 family metallopeptidase [Rhodospirillaceae bacterium]